MKIRTIVVPMSMTSLTSLRATKVPKHMNGFLLRSIVNTHSVDITTKFAVSIKEKQRLPTLYWLPKLHKRPYKARFIANSSSCTTTPTANFMPYYDTVYERDGINYFWSIKNSNEVPNKFKSKKFSGF